MAHLDLEEQEQLDAFKAWWKRYSNLVLSVVVATSLSFTGYEAWTIWQSRQAGEASALYEALTKAASENDAKGVRDAAGGLLENFSRSTYASMGALAAARFEFDRGDLKAAKAQLQWVIDHGRADELRALARLRLAAVLIDEKTPDAALKVLEAEAPAAFAAQFALSKGDALLVAGKSAEAKTAYETALQKAASKTGPFIDSVQMRIDALGH